MCGNLTILLQAIRARAANAFFANFFRLLLAAVSISQWVMLCRLLPSSAGSLPLPWDMAGAAAIYVFNRQLAIRTRRQRNDRNPVGAMPGLYYAVAFTCLLCVLFVLLTDALWITAKVFLGAIAVEAWSIHHTHPRFDSELDTMFRWLANGGMAGIALSLAYGYTIGQRRLRVRQLDLPWRHCPPAWEGLRILQLSDIHIGQNLKKAQLERFVTRANALGPDLVCITGDIADTPTADLENFLPLLARLHATYGVIAVLGNHDHYAGADRVQAALRRLTTFRVLRDEQIAIEIRGQTLHVIGLDDHGRDWARGKTNVSYLGAALSRVPADEPILLLSHRPDVFPQAAERGVALTLSGHTHGGQIGVPWFDGRVRNLAEFMTDFDRGLYERGGSYLYVNSGLGVTGQRIRLNTPREIVVIDLRAAAVRLAA
jgi:predicted MPP superfamily phosphohydrolase